ncbi:MAG: sulfatase, partial [Chloroflexota bacterium]
LQDHGLRKFHGNEHEGYFENKGAITSKLPWEHSWDRFVGREACRFIERYGNEGPFAMMVGFPGPHCPYDPSPDFPGKTDFRPEDMPAPAPDAGDTPKLRQQNIAGNRRPWNGVDYTEFTEEQARKIRAHYCGLMQQIDYEVGQVIETLRSQGLLENTYIVLSSDHGDYLGDHGLIGKASFYDAAMHVPMLVQGPGIPHGQAVESPVELTDVTATMLRMAGAEAPRYMDSRTLPGLGFSGALPRERIVGMLTDGWMLYDGEWRLSKYATGEVTLFNVLEDPQEQQNLVNDSAAAEVYDRMDRELYTRVMDAMRRSYHDRLAHQGDLSQDPGFGREGWQRPFPHSIHGV